MKNDRPKAEFKCLVFDWDGTLADSTHVIVQCMQAAIKQEGLPSRTDQEIRNIIGLGLLEAARVLYPDSTVVDPEILSESYRQHYRAHYKGKTRLFPRVSQILAELHNRGYLLAVATGKSRRGLDSSLRETNTRHLFHASRCADEALSKPHPQMLYDIMQHLDVGVENTLVIGDSSYDMQMANLAGCKSLAVAYGSQDRQRLLEYNPLACLNAPDELIPWLEAQFFR